MLNAISKFFISGFNFVKKEIFSKKTNFQLFIILSFGFIFMVLLSVHLRYMNGPDYWQWPFENRLSLMNLILFVLGSVPFVFAQLVYRKQKNKALSITLLMSTNLMLQIFCSLMQSGHHDLDWLIRIVQSMGATTYYTVAQGITNVHDFLSQFAANVAGYGGHIINKPAGTALYYYVFQRLASNPAASALLGGLMIGVISTFVIPCVYFLSKTLLKEKEKNSDVPFYAASFISIIPSSIVFLPEFDQIYPIFTCLLIIFWVKFLKTREIRYSVIFAVTLAFSTFFNWNILVIGAFLLFYTVYTLITTKFKTLITVLLNAFLALLIYASLYFLLYLLTGYNLIEVFKSNYIAQHAPNPYWIVPYQFSIFFTLYDYLFGNGYISAVMVFFVLRNMVKKGGFVSNYYFWLVVMLIAQLLVVSFGYFLPSETARLWLFLQPFITCAAVLYMKDLKQRQVWLIFGALWIMMLIVSSQLRFVMP